MGKKLKHRFLNAVISGKLGEQTEFGVIITTKEFTDFFYDEAKCAYLKSYLPSVSIEAGRCEMQHNKYLIKLRRGMYKIHHDAITLHKRKHLKLENNFHI